MSSTSLLLPVSVWCLWPTDLVLVVMTQSPEEGIPVHSHHWRGEISQLSTRYFLPLPFSCVDKLMEMNYVMTAVGFCHHTVAGYFANTDFPLLV